MCSNIAVTQMSFQQMSFPLFLIASKIGPTVM
jgi:hypothetical protein